MDFVLACAGIHSKQQIKLLNVISVDHGKSQGERERKRVDIYLMKDLE